MMDWYANRRLNNKPVAKIWFESPPRRQYDDITYDPGKSIPGYYNLFRGFPIKPIPGDCSLFLDLIKNVICSGNEENFQYLLKWFAHLFQRPAELPGTA